MSRALLSLTLLSLTLLSLTLCALSLAACQPAERDRPASEATGAERRAERPAPSLLELGQPPLESLAPTARDQIERATEAIERARRRQAPDSELGQAYGALGNLYHGWSLYEYAEAPYTNARQLLPEDPQWPYFLGHVRRRRGETEAAVASFEETLALQGTDVPTLVWLGRLLVERNLADDAEPYLTSALGLDPSCAPALFLLGQIAAQRQDHEEAVRRYEQALALQPEASRIHYPLAQAYRALGDVERAEAHLKLRGDEQVALADPLLSALSGLARDSRRLEQQGVELFQARRFAEAAERLREAVETDPDNVSARLNLGSALGAMGDAAGAADAFEEVVQRQPGNAMAHYNLGSLANQRGAGEEAIGHFQAAIAANPRYRNAHWSLANILMQSGRCEDALKPFERTLEIDPSLADVRLARVRCLEQLGRWPEARQSLRAARTAHPGDLRIADALARLLATCPDESVRDGAAALEAADDLLAASSNLRYLETLAMANAAAGLHDEAIRWQLEAITRARAAGHDDFATRLEENLARYRQGKTPAPPGS
ncbi:MAG: tetratricopeptide repeat protein [bacterium]|nr:tetratricopeptide repeat protein [bacterium]